MTSELSDKCLSFLKSIPENVAIAAAGDCEPNLSPDNELVRLVQISVRVYGSRLIKGQLQTGFDLLEAIWKERNQSI